MTLLDNERSNITGAINMQRQIVDMITYCSGENTKGRINHFDSIRQEVADRYIESAVMMNFSLRIITIQDAGQVPNYEASIAKMFGSEAAQRTARTGTKVFGLYSNLWNNEDARSPMETMFTRDYVRSIPGTIAAGSSEIQRNVIATRGLGLPRG